ncbi:response regulator [Cohnella rhizosphaerae]|uniref:Response regulator n=1 Tax=Cohnella rhizosphaerae TaxID=1457232 RepID=A0A9X4KQJ6_9BACL|nr:response regulator [Cohnella rhizosphaerae]MDG0808411.1 response regulator [Cohnella rhizosphaerae]
MNIMIVDDEPFFIEQFKRRIEELGKELQVELNVAAECYDGREALRRIAERKPDVVFTDIQMTALSGIDLARAIREFDAELPVVVVSAYPSFDYVREAIRFDVVDYLLKPVDLHALRSLIEKLLLRTRNKSYRAQRASLLALLGSPHASEDADSAVRPLFAFPLYRAFLVQNMAIIQEHPVLVPDDDEEEERLRALLAAELGEDDRLWSIPLDDGRSQLLVAGLREDDRSKLDRFRRAVSLHFSRNGVAPSVGCSEAFGDIRRLGQLVPALRNVLTERTVIGKPQWLDASAPERPLAPQFTKVEKKQLERLLIRGDHAGIASLIRHTVQLWETDGSPMIIVRLQIKEIVGILENDERETKGFKLRNWDARIEELLQMARSFAELADGLIAMLARSFEWELDELNSGDLVRLFAKIELYIAAHIGQPLSLTQLMNKFHISKTLLCGLFRENSGKSFVEYVTAMRMRKAQELMVHFPSMRNKEIAEMVGYADQNYFSRVFAATAGMSPSEYRARHAESG